MSKMGISTDPTLLGVELPSMLVESPSVSTFLPDDESSSYPLLCTTNGTSTPVTFSHPLTPCQDNDSTASGNLCNEDADVKAETSSSTGSSSGIGMDAPDTAATALFHKPHAYQHFQLNNCDAEQDSDGPNGTLSNDTPSFVSWNWPLIRKCTFFVFMSSLLAMCAIVVAMIVTLPKTCNPKTAWYRGSVFYEIFPASFQDSNNDGIGDLRGITQRVDYISSLGVAAVRLNSIFPSTHYPDDFDQPTSMYEIASVLGNTQDLQQLSAALRTRNISLLLDLPIGEFINQLDEATTTATALVATLSTQSNNESIESIEYTDTATRTTPIKRSTSHFSISTAGNAVSAVILRWLQLGVDGFYLKGLENFVDDDRLLANLYEWKQLLGPNRILIANENFIHALSAELHPLALHHLDLIDVHLNVWNDTSLLEQHINVILSGSLAPTDQGTWLHWSIGGVDRQRFTRNGQNLNVTLAAILMQLMLPGTPNIFYGDEIALEAIADPESEHNETKHLHHLSTMEFLNTIQQFTNSKTLPWLPHTAQFSYKNFQIVTDMIKLRDRSPSLYKNAICKPEMVLSNTEVHCHRKDILVVERVYPRRNSFVSVSNFSDKNISMDMTALYFSGVKMLGDDHGKKIYFAEFAIGPWQTVVVKLDK
ncbi:amino acid transporter heavy chain SLC3A1-like isoform X1 [Eurosta solidaginis]|uniref:amino acid transporter heavy chain SLC3A1-like isoform X1 n=1 Tax=Eurosta solidaginis TaxID=178769 RepID=UPI0035316E90